MEIRMMKKTKQIYVQPTCKVVELHVTNQLLAGSGETQGELKSLDSYSNGRDPFSESEY
jgi:hypothetical protein